MAHSCAHCRSRVTVPGCGDGRGGRSARQNRPRPAPTRERARPHRTIEDDTNAGLGAAIPARKWKQLAQRFDTHVDLKYGHNEPPRLEWPSPPVRRVPLLRKWEFRADYLGPQKVLRRCRSNSDGGAFLRLGRPAGGETGRNGLAGGVEEIASESDQHRGQVIRVYPCRRVSAQQCVDVRGRHTGLRRPTRVSVSNHAGPRLAQGQSTTTTVPSGRTTGFVRANVRCARGCPGQIAGARSARGTTALQVSLRPRIKRFGGIA